MIGPFVLTAQGVCASIGRDYNLLIQQLIHEILVVLDDPGDFPMFLAAATGLENERAASVDPALEYLLPAMSLDSDEAARLRALTEDMLRAEKSERLRRICHELDSAISDGTHCVMLNEDEAWVWLAGFTDIRLALAGELRISSTRGGTCLGRTARSPRKSRTECGGDLSSGHMVAGFTAESVTGDE